jgi:hypothetical protein
MDESNGYFLLWRKLWEHPFWRERRKFSKAEAWIDIIKEARWKDGDAKVLIGNKVMTCCRGQTLKSLTTWAHRWGWSEPSVRRFLKLCEEQNMIRRESDGKMTRITVCNYGEYQDPRRQNDAIVTRSRRDDDAIVTTEEIKKKRKEKKHKGNHVDLPDWIPTEAWDSWCEVRKAKRSDMTPGAARLAIKALDALRKKGMSPLDVLNQSILNGYVGVFPLRGYETKKNPTYQPTTRPTVRFDDE